MLYSTICYPGSLYCDVWELQGTPDQAFARLLERHEIFTIHIRPRSQDGTQDADAFAVNLRQAHAHRHLLPMMYDGACPQACTFVLLHMLRLAMVLGFHLWQMLLDGVRLPFCSRWPDCYHLVLMLYVFMGRQ